MSLYFEDFPVGHEHETRGRTITEADIVAFAGLSGDYNEIHTNEQYSAGTRYGRRVAHGILTLSIATGLSVQTNLMTESIVAFYGIDKLRFTKPVFIGDTIRVRKKVIDTLTKGREIGVVTFETTVVNQNNEPVLVYRDKVVLKQKAVPASA
ncbi:MAG: MaoC/PaaZ C-terminal domain-containing protein [Bryobacteraceae bacterium]